MTPEERQLITGLFDRMRGFALTAKDGEAEALINQQVGSVRDAPYMLVQSVLIQEQALQQAEARIKELEEEVRTLQSAPQQRAQSGGSFLGGLFGSRQAAEPDRGASVGGSVPAIGSRATPPVYGNQSAWGGQQAGPQPPFGAAAAPQPAGGGFLQSAMTTAAGVAGGMLAANAISSLLGGHSSAHAASPAAAPAATPTPQPAADAPKSDASNDGDQRYNDGYQDAAQDASDDEGGWFGGGDDSYDA